MFGGVSIEAGGVGFDDLAKLRREIALIAGCDRAFDVDQMPKEIAARAFLAEMGAKAAACGEDDELDGGEIVLGVRVGKAVSRFGVGGA
jgi:hypothetical protein